jgi:hypothetical protein
MDQRGHQPIDEHQLVTGAGTFGPLAKSAPRSMTATFKAGLPRQGQLLGQTSEMTPRDPREQLMSQHSRLTMIATPGSCHQPSTMPHPLSRTNSLKITVPSENVAPAKNTMPSENVAPAKNTMPSENVAPAKNTVLPENVAPRARVGREFKSVGSVG